MGKSIAVVMAIAVVAATVADVTLGHRTLQVGTQNGPFNLSFSGFVSGPMVGTSNGLCGVDPAGHDYQVSEAGTINGTTYDFDFVVNSYQGPGNYDVNISTNTSYVLVRLTQPGRTGWLGQSGSIRVNGDEKSGKISANMLAPGPNTQVQVTGSWTCQ
jgi:hypothetical protein